MAAENSLLELEVPGDNEQSLCVRSVEKEEVFLCSMAAIKY